MTAAKMLLDQLGFDFSERDIEEQISSAVRCKRMGDWVGSSAYCLAALLMAMALDDLDKQTQIGIELGRTALSDSDSVTPLMKVASALCEEGLSHPDLFEKMKKWTEDGILLSNIVTWFRGAIMTSDKYIKSLLEAATGAFVRMILIEMEQEDEDDFNARLIALNEYLEQLVSSSSANVMEGVNLCESAIKAKIDFDETLKRSRTFARKIMKVEENEIDGWDANFATIIRMCALIAGTHFMLHSGIMTEETSTELEHKIDELLGDKKEDSIAESNPKKGKGFARLFSDFSFSNN